MQESKDFSFTQNNLKLVFSTKEKSPRVARQFKKRKKTVSQFLAEIYYVCSLSLESPSSKR